MPPLSRWPILAAGWCRCRCVVPRNSLAESNPAFLRQPGRPASRGIRGFPCTPHGVVGFSGTLLRHGVMKRLFCLLCVRRHVMLLVLSAHAKPLGWLQTIPEIFPPQNDSAFPFTSGKALVFSAAVTKRPCATLGKVPLTLGSGKNMVLAPHKINPQVRRHSRILSLTLCARYVWLVEMRLLIRIPRTFCGARKSVVPRARAAIHVSHPWTHDHTGDAAPLVHSRA